MSTHSFLKINNELEFDNVKYSLGKKEVGGLLYELLINPLGNVFSSHAMIK